MIGDEMKLLLANLKRINNSLVRVIACLALIAKSSTPKNQKEIHSLLNALVNDAARQLAPPSNVHKKP